MFTNIPYIQLARKFNVGEIDDAIDEWYEYENVITLQNWLGLSHAEYNAFSTNQSDIWEILSAR